MGRSIPRDGFRRRSCETSSASTISTSRCSNNMEDTWEQIISNINPEYRPGQSRLSLIKQLIYIPSIYLLGDLLHSKKMKNAAKEAWSSSAQHVPEEMKVPFKKAGYTINSTTKKIGLAHQYKRYCLEKNCHRCEVFKKAIHS